MLGCHILRGCTSADLGVSRDLGRPIIRGQLNVAIAKDPNKEYFPLAIAVVEAETKD